MQCICDGLLHVQCCVLTVIGLCVVVGGSDQGTRAPSSLLEGFIPCPPIHNVFHFLPISTK